MLKIKQFGKLVIQASNSEQEQHSLEWQAASLVQSTVLRWVSLEISC